MNPNYARRDFLKSSAGFMAAVAAGVARPRLAAAEPPRTAGESRFRRVGGPKLKTSLNVFSFNDAILGTRSGQAPTMTLLDVLDFCAEQNFDGVDPTGYYFPNYPKPPTDEYIATFKKRAFELGLDISGTGIRNNFATSDAARRKADVQLARQWIEVAAKLGAPVIRLFAGHEEAGADRNEVAKWIADALQECADYGQRHGVLIGVQNHDDFLKTAEQTMDLVERVQSDWLGVILDTGNFHQDPYREIAAVLPYTVNFQVKESPRGKDSPERLDLDRFVQIVRESGYRGYLPIETLTITGVPYKPFEVIPAFHAQVKAAFERGS